MWWTVIIAFFVAILSGLGVGSAGLLVVFLTSVEHLPQLTAQGLNLLLFIFSSGAALVVHMLRIPLLFSCILLMLPGGILGTFLGTAVAHIVSQALLRRLFGILLIVSGVLGLLKKTKA
ncbi:MAG: sulfite exporter TauE/SafE family protein [Clostridia bacterium]|nr:sulfite exporter TauE/SafE family protein [Clostridia bacterium]